MFKKIHLPLQAQINKWIPGVLCLLLLGCSYDQGKRYEMVGSVLDEIKAKYAPDKRVALFKINAVLDEDRLILKGETDQQEALDELMQRLGAESFKVASHVETLPNEVELKGKTYGVVNNSVANIRSKPKHSAELATQAILGDELKVLKQECEWYLVQTADDYISWLDHGGLVTLDEVNFNKWNQAEKVIYTKPFGNVYASPTIEGGRVSDIVLGATLGYEGEEGDYYKVKFPDGRLGYVQQHEAQRLGQWLREVEPSSELLKSTAMQLLGAPYMWGGTSTKGMDCSGFTKTVYRMNGLIIPRDASQQVHAGNVVDEELMFQGLEVGDLLFFGRPATDSTRKKVTHVALWIGDGQFIHSSKRVRISSVDSLSTYYDGFNKSRYLGSKRYLGNLTGNIEDLKGIDRIENN